MASLFGGCCACGGEPVEYETSSDELFGDVLLTKDGEKPVTAVFADKTAIGVYFAAHGLAPCKAFTPKLVELFNTTLKGKGMEIVFVSSDDDQGAFDKSYGEMPWCALPYAKRHEKNALCAKYKVSGLPNLVVLEPNGALITAEGMAALERDPTAQRYPWPEKAARAKSVLNALGPELIRSAGRKHIGLYFAANSIACRHFTPKLVKSYEDGLKYKMEIIFVSSDNDQASYDENVKKMPWLAVPFDKTESRKTLADMCGVEGIPCLVVVGRDGAVITKEALSMLRRDPKGAKFPDSWVPQPWNYLHEKPEDLNWYKSLIAVGKDEVMAAAVKAVAEEYYAAASKDVSTMQTRFFMGPDGPMVDQLRALAKLDPGNKLVLLDLQHNGGAFWVCESEACDVSVVKQFLADARVGKIDEKKLLYWQAPPSRRPPVLGGGVTLVSVEGENQAPGQGAAATAEGQSQAPGQGAAEGSTEEPDQARGQGVGAAEGSPEERDQARGQGVGREGTAEGQNQAKGRGFGREGGMAEQNIAP